MERFAFLQAHEMNQGRWKRFWTWCQRHIGSHWIQLATYNLMNVHGLEQVEAAPIERPLLLVANHRSFFDMYAVSSVLFRRTKRPLKLFFPVRGQLFYDSLFGVFVNFLGGWWSMYPPIFVENEKRVFDKYSMRRLTQLCKGGTAHVIGFHPEGTRNLNSDSYSYLRAQPGVGKLIKDAEPMVIPVFIAGLGNKVFRQLYANWNGGEPVRVRFGSPLDLSEFLSKKDHVRTYKEISEFVMSKIIELGEEDRAVFGKK
jgi:1-acyl-sn-glycerol-3-phosphate acyltransferase